MKSRTLIRLWMATALVVIAAASVTGQESRGQAYPFKLGLKIGGVFSSPTGSYYSDSKSGVGVSADVFFPVGKHISLMAGFTKSGIGSKDLIGTTVRGGGYVISGEPDFSVYKFAGGIQYNSIPRPMHSSSLLYRLYCGLGSISHRLSGRVLAEYPDGGETYTLDVSGTESKFVISTGGGVIKMIDNYIGVELGAGIDMVFSGDKEIDAPLGDAFILELKLGFVAMIGIRDRQ